MQQLNGPSGVSGQSAVAEATVKTGIETGPGNASLLVGLQAAISAPDQP